MNRKLLVVALLLATGTAQARDTMLPATTPGPYRVGAGDEVRIDIFGLDQASKSYVVGDTGTISIPLLGPLPAADKTVAEIETMIADALRRKQIMNTPSVSAQIAKYRPFFILGEVQKPGQYDYVPGMSVLTAVSIAGGYTFRAQKKRATIVRNHSGQNIKGEAPPEATLLPGDTVKIAEAWF